MSQSWLLSTSSRNSRNISTVVCNDLFSSFQQDRYQNILWGRSYILPLLGPYSYWSLAWSLLLGISEGKELGNWVSWANLGSDLMLQISRLRRSRSCLQGRLQGWQLEGRGGRPAIGMAPMPLRPSRGWPCSRGAGSHKRWAGHNNMSAFFSGRPA